MLSTNFFLQVSASVNARTCCAVAEDLLDSDIYPSVVFQWLTLNHNLF